LKKYLPALVAGFSAGVLHVVPLTKSLTCCLIVPLAAVAAIMLEQKANAHIGDFDIKRGAFLGLLTGIFAALFGSFLDIFITFVTRNNEILGTFNELTEIVDSIPVPTEVKNETLELMHSVAESIRETGFSAIYAISVIFNNLIVNSIFGTIGGLVGTKVLNARNSKSE
jgi:energy-converting hydrogenase Eha subunit A